MGGSRGRPADRRTGNPINRLLLYLIAGILLSLSACVSMRDPEASQDYRADIVAQLADGEEAGQTFISHRSRLENIQLWMQPTADGPFGPGQFLKVELYPSSNTTQSVFATNLSFERIKAEFPISINFPPLPGPPGQSYYLSLKPTGGGVNVYGRAEDSYPYGSLYIDNAPSEADIAFRLAYDYGWMAAAEDLTTALLNAWLIVPLLAVTWLPGRVLLGLVLKTRRVQGNPSGLILDWGERTALSIGLSLAVIAVSLLWTTLAGIKWNRTMAWAVSGILLLIYLWQIARDWQNKKVDPTHPKESGTRISIVSLGLGAVFLLTFGVRLAMVRDLAAPAWVDSVHHAIITQKIVDAGGYPGNYEPYLQSSFATYHSGFHAALATFIWLTGMKLPAAMLLFSQVLNALMVFPVYLLTTSLLDERSSPVSSLAGVFAALIAGLFTPMPAYYASWGRFTQLAGLLILPTCAALILQQIRNFEGDSGAAPRQLFIGQGLVWTVLGGLSIAGLALTHYRVMAFLVCLLAAYSAIAWISAIRKKRGGTTIAIYLTILGSAAIVGLAFSLPWWPAALQTLFLPQASATLPSFGEWARPFGDFAWGYLNTALGKQAMVLAGLGWGLAVLRRKAMAASLPLWVVLLFIIANPGALALPGGGFVNNTSVEIMLFIPLGTLGGWLVGWSVAKIGERLKGWMRWTFGGLVMIGALAAGLWGARNLMPILNPGTILARQADLKAADWIAKNIPEGETILINSFAWGYGKLAGNDGGYWIAPLTGRQTLPPAVLHGLSNPPEVVQKTDALAKEAFDKSGDPQALSKLMLENGLRYIYLGVRGGPMSAKELLDSGLFTAIYDNEGTWVFKVNS